MDHGGQQGSNETQRSTTGAIPENRILVGWSSCTTAAHKAFHTEVKIWQSKEGRNAQGGEVKDAKALNKLVRDLLALVKHKINMEPELYYRSGNDYFRLRPQENERHQKKIRTYILGNRGNLMSGPLLDRVEEQLQQYQFYVTPSQFEFMRSRTRDFRRDVEQQRAGARHNSLVDTNETLYVEMVNKLLCSAAVEHRETRLAIALLNPSEGAHLSFRDLEVRGIVGVPVVEDYGPNNPRPDLACDEDRLSDFIVENTNRSQTGEIWPIRLMRKHQPTQAYAWTDDVVETLDRVSSDWGHVYYGVVYHLKEGTNNVFVRPPARKIKRVAIQRLKKRAVQQHLDQGGQENPYKDVARLREIGDSEHVLECLDFLEDREYLYIVTEGTKGSTLYETVPWYSGENLGARKIHRIFCKILRILGYLERRQINHRSLTPRSFMFLPSGKLVLSDLARSVKIPVDSSTSQRMLMIPQDMGAAWLQWRSPETHFNNFYDGVTEDLWSALVILFNLQTNHLLYDQVLDESFMQFVIYKGWNLDSSQEALSHLDTLRSRAQHDHEAAHENHKVTQRGLATLRFITSEVSQLLSDALAYDPRLRLSLAQVMESPYVRNGVMLEEDDHRNEEERSDLFAGAMLLEEDDHRNEEVEVGVMMEEGNPRNEEGMFNRVDGAMLGEDDHRNADQEILELFALPGPDEDAAPHEDDGDIPSVSDDGGVAQEEVAGAGETPQELEPAEMDAVEAEYEGGAGGADMLTEALNGILRDNRENIN